MPEHAAHHRPWFNALCAVWAALFVAAATTTPAVSGIDDDLRLTMQARLFVIDLEQRDALADPSEALWTTAMQDSLVKLDEEQGRSLLVDLHNAAIPHASWSAPRGSAKLSEGKLAMSFAHSRWGGKAADMLPEGHGRDAGTASFASLNVAYAPTGEDSFIVNADLAAAPVALGPPADPDEAPRVRITAARSTLQLKDGQAVLIHLPLDAQAVAFDDDGISTPADLDLRRASVFLLMTLETFDASQELVYPHLREPAEPHDAAR